MKDLHNISRMALIVALSSTYGVMPSFSEEVEDVVDVITVTATKTERKLFETPSAVSVITQEEIDKFIPLSYNDVLEGTPGLTVQGGARRISEEPSIRGFSDQQLVLRLDGARQNFDQAHRGRFFIDPDLIKRVEVIRGSASSLYGSGAIGGVLSLESKGAKDLLRDGQDIGARARFGYQSNGDEFFSSGGVYGQSGNFDIFANIIYREVFNDLIDGDGDPIVDSQDKIWNGHTTLGFEPTTNQRFEINADFFNSEGMSPTASDDVSSPTTVVQRDTKEHNLRANYAYHDPDNMIVDLKIVAHYGDINIREDRVVDGRLDVSNFKSYGVDAHNTTRFTTTDNFKAALTYGFEYFEDTQDGTRDGIDRPEFPDAKRKFAAGYAQMELDIMDGLISIIPGLRYDSFDLNSNGDFVSRDEGDLTPRISLGFSPTESLYIWGSYSEAFRAPTLTELYNDGVHFAVPEGFGPGTLVLNEFVPTPLLEAEEAKTWEVGFRIRQGEILTGDDSFELNVNYFKTDVDNFVDTFVTYVDPTIPPHFTPPFGPVTFFGTTQNISSQAKIDGFEGEIKYDSTYFSTSISGFTANGQNPLTNEGIAAISPDSVTIRLTGKIPEYGIQLGGRATVTAAQNDVPTGSVTTEGYQTVDLFVNWSPSSGALKNTVFSIALDNVFDETYSVHPTVIRQPGRSFRFNLSHNF